MNQLKKRVAVIGGGISGLAAIKSCLEEDLEPHCFERYTEIGGVWVYNDGLRPNQGSAMYDCLITNSSKAMMSFSDFPIPKDYPPYLTYQNVLKYVQDYARHFDLERYIQFNTTVTSVKRTHDFETSGQWEVTTQIGEDEKAREVTEIYDAVFICSGMYKKPHMPDYPGLEEFEGMKVHTNEYRKAEPYRGKTVMVMGASNSAGDVAADVSRCAEQVHLTMRHGCWVVRRMADDSVPIDMIINKRVVQSAPDFITGKVAQYKASINFSHDKLGLTAEAGLLNSEVMISDTIGDRILCGKVQCRPGVKRFTQHGVEFVDGTIVDNLDAVIFATGYELKFEFIDSDIIQETFKDLELYLHIFPPRLQHPTLAVVGCVATLGGQPPVFELQTRLATRVFKGDVQLPDEPKMIADIQRRKDHLYKTFGKHRLFFPPVAYQDEMADLIGAKPRMRDYLLSDPKLALQLFFGPCYPAHYRLCGPHQWQGARKVIDESWEDTAKATRTRVLVPNNNVKKTYDYSKIVLAIFGIVIVIALAI